MKESIRQTFLISFARALVANTPIPKSEIRPELADFMKSRNTTQMPTAPIPNFLPQRVPIKIQRIESPSLVKTTMENTSSPVIKTLEKKEQFQKSVFGQSNTPQQSFERLRPFLNDPSVFSVECTGPEKPLIVNRQGIIQTTNVSLNQSEITNIIEEVSNKTRIPLVSGMLKAAFDNLILTAVTSEFVGSRFLIQKKQSNFQRPQQNNPNPSFGLNPPVPKK